MAIYVAEINGRAVAAFASESKLTADALVGGRNNEGNAFRADLSAFEIWDQESKIVARPADNVESEQWRASYAKARQNGEADDEEGWTCFFVNGDTKSRQDFGRSV